jgi:hypothetical protein
VLSLRKCAFTLSITPNWVDTASVIVSISLQGDSQLQCDYDYMNEVEEACDRDLKCSMSARQAIYVLRNIGGTRIPQRECIRNPCLNMALRSIAY